MTTAAVTIPSVQRPAPLCARKDLQAERSVAVDGVFYVVKDPVALRYFRLTEAQHHILTEVDGRKTIEEIREGFGRKFPTLRLGLVELQNLVADLHRKGLLLSTRSGQAQTLREWDRERRWRDIVGAFRNILYIRLPGWDPESTLKQIYPVARWMFTPLVFSLVCFALTLVGLSLAIHFDEFYHRLPEFNQFFGWKNLILLWLTLGVCKVIHELGHGTACRHYGGECHEIGLSFLVGSPSLYCDVSDAWRLPNKWPRIVIGLAGMYIELAMSAVAFAVWWWTNPGLLHYLALNVFFVTTITTIIVNANPLLRYDGYYILGDLVEVPNLQKRAEQSLKRVFAWCCLGVKLPYDPRERTGFGFVAYALAAAGYRWMTLGSMVLFTWHTLKPYGLQMVALIGGAVTVATIVCNLGASVWHVITLPGREPMQRWKVGLTLTILAGMMAGGLMWPLPHHVYASFVIEPLGVQAVHAATPGILAEIHVHPGQFVRRGDVLIKLENMDKLREYLSEKQTVRQREIELGMQQQMGRGDGEQVAAEILKSARERLAETRQQLRKLVITAPCDGVVIAPISTAEPDRQAMKTQLANWFGTPLNAANVGCAIDARTHLLSIAPSATGAPEKFQATLVVDQSDRNDVRAGQPLQLRFENLPDRLYTGTVKHVGEQAIDTVPVALSNKTGGELPTTTEQGAEKLLSAAYQGTVILAEDVDLLRTGMRGRARLTAETRTVREWAWRYLCQTVHFRM